MSIFKKNLELDYLNNLDEIVKVFTQSEIKKCIKCLEEKIYQDFYLKKNNKVKNINYLN